MTQHEKYIKTLESLVCFYASCYEACKNEYQSKYFKICSSSNPDRRELTEQEKGVLMKFPQIQGSKMILATAKLAKYKIGAELPVTDVLGIIETKYNPT